VFDSGEIVGATAIGRATAILLQMNTDAQVRVRTMWLRLGLIQTVT
jgi:hypothetical protein